MEEAADREDDGLPSRDARRSAHLDLGNALLIREDVRSLWTWTTLEQLVQDVRYALRTMVRHRLVVGLAMLSLALGIGANTAIYSFMDALLFRALPVPQPDSLVVVRWHSKPFGMGRPAGSGSEFVMRAMNGNTYRAASGVTASIMPFPAFERLQQVSGSVLSGLFAYYPGSSGSPRTHTTAIRIALGARQGTVMWMILREVCALAVVGLAISLPVALVASRLVQSFLFELKPNDPITIVSAVSALVLASLLAGCGPARRAARINPTAALRAE